MSLSQFKVLIFDVYGTLVDWETGIYNSLAPLFADAGHRWSKSDVLLAFSSVELDIQAKKPNALYADILAEAYEEVSRRIRGQPSLPIASGNTAAPILASGDTCADGASKPTTSRVISSVGTPSSATSTSVSSPNTDESTHTSTVSSAAAADSDAAAAFATSLADWPIFPDTIPALAKLSSPALGLKLVVLSNVDRASFAYTRAALERGFAFAAAFTAEEIGSYKPDPRNFEYTIARLQADDPSLKREQILVVAQSLPHDHVPAQALGLSSVWIDRPDSLTCLDGDGVPKTRGGKEVFATRRYRNLGEFASAVEEARAKPS